MTEPLEVTQDHVIELGKLGLDCLILSECPADLGRACHCVSATMATLAANEACVRFMMDAPGGSVVRSVLALVEVGSVQEWDVQLRCCGCWAFPMASITKTITPPNRTTG